MALTLPWLVAAVVSVLRGAVWIPAPPLVDRVVSRVVNDTAATLAARRGVRLTRPLLVRLVGRPEMAQAAERAATEAGGDGEGEGPAPPPSSGPLSPRAAGGLRQELLADLGMLQGTPPLNPIPIPIPMPTPTPTPTPFSDVTGLYDPTHQVLLLANWADLGTGNFALARDIAQALLDRRFNLERWLAALPASRPPPLSPPVSFDTFLARAAVVYGDATTQALEQMDPEGTLPSVRALANIAASIEDKLALESNGQSPFLLQQRLFLELDGLRFVAAFRARSPWSVVDELWRRPPQSTEQILHPEKYARAENPDDVAARLPERPHPNWRITYRDTLGEWGVRLFLSLGGNDYRAERAAAGWHGDSALLLQSASESMPPPSPTFAAWMTTWDDDSDADDFAAEAAGVLAHLAQVPLPDGRPASGRLRLVDAEGRLFALDRRRNTVGILVAAPADAESLLANLMNATVPTPPAFPARRPERRALDQSRSRPR